jgi:copper homeostasis protein
MILEACVENLTEALIAQDRGAARIELCDNLATGGTTPSFGTIALCKKMLKIPVVVMIRPRGGNFSYSTPEIESMIEDIRICNQIGTYGIAVGALTTSGEVDTGIMRRFIREAGSMQVTFHKAIDETVHIEKEISRLTHLGIHRVLTSGGAPTALEGAIMLNRLIQITQGKLTILAAGKVSSSNLHTLADLIQTTEFHGRKIVGDLI